MQKALYLIFILLFLLSSQMIATIDINNYVADNAVAPLDIPSYVLNNAGQKEVVHPDVIYEPGGWNGYKYWMAYTPFPDAIAIEENPCIAVSNDRENWIEPPGGSNPIDSFASSASTYNSDPELILSVAKDTLYCIWRRVASSTQEVIYYKSSTDGITWSEKEAIMSSTTTNAGGLISPALVYQDGKYRLWTVRKPPRGTTAPRVVEYREASSLAGLQAAVAIPTNIVPFTYDALLVPVSETWHLNVIYHNGYYWMINTVGPYTVSSGGDIYLGYSADGVNWTFGSLPVLYRRDPFVNWDRILYRASILPMNDGTDNFYIWYSVQRKVSTPHMIGLTVTTGGATLPIELSSFTARITAFDSVRLDWTTQSESNVLGYYVLRNTNPNPAIASSVSSMISGTNTSTMVNYTFLDQENLESGLLYYWLQSVDFDGTTKFHGPISIELDPTPDNSPPPVVHSTSLQRVFPNPFNPDTTIDFDVAKPTSIRIDIYNIRGERITKLVDQYYDKGSYSCVWDGKDGRGQVQASGVYIIKMNTPENVTLHKVLLLK